MSLKSLQSPVGQLKILVYLYRNEQATGPKIYRGTASHPEAMYLALSNLEELKLVQKLSDDTYKLTKKGKVVAEYLDQVDNLLQE